MSVAVVGGPVSLTASLLTASITVSVKHSDSVMHRRVERVIMIQNSERVSE